MPKEVIRVYFLDGTVKSFGVEDETTAEQLTAQICEKIELKLSDYFGLFERVNGIDRFLDPFEKIIQIKQMWKINGWEEGDSIIQKSQKGALFIFKKAVFLRSETELMKDSVARNLCFIQAVRSVIEGEFSLQSSEVSHFAALQFQAVYGDHKPLVHIPGFLCDKLPEYIPKTMIKDKKSKEWESSIYKNHSGLIGKTRDAIEVQYLEEIKKVGFYGTHFFNCKVDSIVGTKKLSLPDKIIIGINAEGILLLKKDQDILSAYNWFEMFSWVAPQEKNLLTIEVSNEGEVFKFTLETSQSRSINHILSLYVDFAWKASFEKLFNSK